VDAPIIDVKLFARLRELAGGAESVPVPLRPGSTAADLRKQLTEAFPVLAPLLVHVAVAVNHEYADDSTVIPPGAEVAIIPPVSGG
jgi:molybdopterin converting factor subunit 1